MNATANTIIVYLNQADAVLFADFQKKHEIIEAMHQAGAFNIEYGKASLSFTEGRIQNVIVEEMKWRR